MADLSIEERIYNLVESVGYITAQEISDEVALAVRHVERILREDVRVAVVWNRWLLQYEWYRR